MIFKTQNNELVIFGNTISDVKRKIEEFNKTRINDDLFGEKGAISAFFGNKSSQPILDDKLLGDFEAFKDLFNSSSLSAEAVAEDLGGVDDSIVNYAKTCKNGELTTEGFTSSIKGMSVGAKAGEVALQGLAMAGNVLAGMFITWAIGKVIEGIDKLIVTSKEAKEAMQEATDEYENAKSEVESLNSELETTSKRIDELNAKQNLSLIEKDELDKLQESNRELENQIKLKEKELALKQKEAAVAAAKSVETMRSYGGRLTVDDELSDYYYNDALNRNDASSLLYDKYDLTKMFAGYKAYNQFLKEAKTQNDTESITYYTDTIAETETSLSETLLEFYEQKASMQDYYDLIKDQDPLSLTTDDKAVIETYEAIVENIKDINMLLDPSGYKTETISGIFEKVDFKGVEDKLIALGKDGTLSIETLTNKFPDLIKYLNLAGISAEDLYQYIMNLSNPDAVNYDEVRKQLMNSVGIGDTVDSAEEADLMKKLTSSGVFSENGLEAYLAVKAKFTDGETAFWSVDDWIYHIQEELKQTDMTEEVTIFSGFSEDDTKLIDDFQSEVKTLGDALSSLQSGEDVDFTDLVEEFPELQGQSENLEEAIKTLIQEAFEKLQKTMGERLPSDVQDSLQEYVDTATGASVSLSNAFSSIQKSQEALSKFKAAMSTGLTDDVLNSVGSLSAKLNELVAGFYAGAVSADELFEALTDHYNTDLQNYSKALIAKNEYSNEFYNSVVLSNAEFVNTFKEQYGIDLTNYKSYNEAKLKIGNKTITALGDNWAKYYDSQALALTAEGNRLLSMLSQSSDAKSHKDYAEIMSQISQYKQAQQALNSLNNVVYDSIEANFKDVTTGLENATKETEDKTKDYIDAYMAYMEAALNASKIDYKTYSSEVSAFLKKMFDEGKVSAKEYHDYVGQMLEQQKSVMDKVISAVVYKIDEQIESYEEQQDEIEERYQSEIDYLDTVIEQYEDQKKALQDANDEYELQLALQKARYNLERAQSQRTQKVYTASQGFIYTANSESIRDAEDDLRKAELDIEIDNIDKAIEKIEEQQKSLQEAMDKEKEQLQELIDNLNKYRDKWNEISSEYENTQNDLFAQQILGAGYENDILNGRLDVLNNFKNQYIDIQKAITNEAWASANAQLKAAEAAQQATSNTSSTASSSAASTSSAPAPAPAPATTSTTQTASTSQAKNYWVYKTLGSYKSNGEASSKIGMLGGDGIIKVGNEWLVIKWKKGFASNGEASSQISALGGSGVYKRYHTGLDEGYVGSVQSDEKRLDILQKAGNGQLLSNEVPTILQKGELVLTKAQQINIAEKLLKNSLIPKINLPDLSTLNNIRNVPNNTTPVIQNINLTLPNVTNTDGYERLKKELQTMQIQAIQFVNKR